MHLKTLFILFNVLSTFQGVNGLVEDQNNGKPVPVSQPDDVIQEPESPNGLKITDINFNEGKSNKLGVHDIEDQDNEPTPHHAKKPISPYTGDEVSEEEAKQPWDSFIMSVSMIIVSEIGDKTFLIAALMAMRYSRVVVFAAAFSSLAIMTVLSGIVGHALPTLLSKRVTQFLASVLFIVFGYKLLREGLSMSKDVGVDEELAEVEEEIKANDLNNQMDSMESGNVQNANQQWYVKFGEQVKDLASFVLSPIFIQVFVMTFLGEWGDRSQIATIALAAGSDYWYVIIGAILGHGVCTFAACIGGKFLAKKISMRNVTLGGAISFFIFSILYFYEAYYDSE